MCRQEVFRVPLSCTAHAITHGMFTFHEWPAGKNVNHRLQHLRPVDRLRIDGDWRLAFNRRWLAIVNEQRTLVGQSLSLPPSWHACKRRRAVNNSMYFQVVQRYPQVAHIGSQSVGQSC